MHGTEKLQHLHSSWSWSPVSGKIGAAMRARERSLPSSSEDALETLVISLFLRDDGAVAVAQKMAGAKTLLAGGRGGTPSAP